MKFSLGSSGSRGHFGPFWKKKCVKKSFDKLVSLTNLETIKWSTKKWKNYVKTWTYFGSKMAHCENREGLLASFSALPQTNNRILHNKTER